MSIGTTKGIGTVAIVIACLMLSYALSWGDAMYVNKATDGSLSISIFSDQAAQSNQVTQINALLDSCKVPDFFWDAGIGAFRLRGYDGSSSMPKWTATVNTSGIASVPTPPTPITCSSGAAGVVSAEIPSICTGYTWSPCSNGITTATGIPSGCTPDQPTTLSCGSTLPTCIYTYNPNPWPTTCTPGTLQTRTATASNSPCLPVPADTIRICPATVPGAPTNVAASAGNASAVVSFSAASNGGSPITGYTVTSSGGQTATGTASPITVTGLTNGTSYTFTVKATNAIGTGPASATSNAVIPNSVTVPGPPTSVSATAGNASATVAFAPPASNGGSPITSYKVVSSGGQAVTGTSSPITVTGLTNGTTYTFQVSAINAIGTGAPSSPSNGVTPAGTGEVPITDTLTYGIQNNKVYTLAPGAMQYFKITVPAGQTSSRFVLASGSQNGYTEICAVQASELLTPADAALYTATYIPVKTYPPTVWCTTNASDYSGESRILKQSTSITSTTTTLLPGAYYMIAKNLSNVSVQYYVYWKTY